MTLFDIHQCQASIFPAENVQVITPPAPVISGRQDYCIGDSIRLNGFVGFSPPFVYKWYRNGTLVGTGYNLTDYVTDTGHNYNYTLSIGIVVDSVGLDTCFSTSAVDSIRTYPFPPKPVITDSLLDCNSYSILLTATDAQTGVYNWNDGHTGATDNIYSGGLYKVWFTNLQGCISDTVITVPLSPAMYAPYLATGCYDVCVQQLPLKLYGPPDAFFTAWDWTGSIPDFSGTGYMPSYSIDTAGAYGWTLNTGLCSQSFGTLNISTDSCNSKACDELIISADSLTCTPGNPSSYTLTLTLYDGVSSAVAWTLGTDMGPITPFSGTITGGPVTYTGITFSYTMLSTSIPDSITLEAGVTLLDGSKCFKKYRIAVPTCTWEAERHTYASADSQKSNNLVTNGLMVFPNPAANTVTLAYDYGNDGNTGRNLAIYNQMGQRMQYQEPTDIHGNWNVDISNWSPGIYLVRMDGDGKTLQVQKLVVRH